MKPKPTTNVRAIAEVAEVHFTTVSMALRKHPSIPVATRQRIQKIARKMGYKANPLVSTLMTQVRASRKVSYIGNIAYFFNSRELLQRHEHLNSEYKVLSNRAKELGFNLETFFMDEYESDEKKLFRTLKNRGIHALITHLFFPSPQLISFPWHQFACASLGQSHSSETVDPSHSLHIPPWVPTVTGNCFTNLSLIFNKMIQIKYRRPGLALRSFVDELSEYHYSTAFTGLCKKNNLEYQNNIYIGDDTDPKFSGWIKKSKLDVLISHEYAFYKKAKNENYSGHFINLDWVGGPESGINIHRERMAAKVVDIVVAQLHRNERGEPPVPYNVLIDGEWHQGDISRKRKKPMQKHPSF
jgi:LacI family transcriptional regulator